MNKMVRRDLKRLWQYHIFNYLDHITRYIKASIKNIRDEITTPTPNPIDIKRNKTEPKEIKHVLIYNHKIDYVSNNKPNNYNWRNKNNKRRKKVKHIMKW